MRTSVLKRFYSNNPLWLVLLAGFAALLLLNLAMRYALHGMAVDVTEDRLFTLSDGTRQILGDIKEPITLKLYYSDGLAERIPAIANFTLRVQDMLKQFQEIGGKNINLSIINPEPFSDNEDAALAAGLQGVPVDNGAEKYYFGLVGTNSVDGKELIPFFQPEREAFLEYDLTRLIYSLSNPKKPVVGILTTLPMMGDAQLAMLTGQPTTSWQVVSQIAGTFKSRLIDTSASAIDPDVAVLMVVHPQGLSATSLYAIDQFVMRGGKLLMFVDSMAESQRTASTLSLGNDQDKLTLLRMLRTWGVDFDPGQFVADYRYARQVGMEEDGRQMPVDYLAWLGVDAEGINSKDPVTSDLKVISLASAGALRTVKDKPNDIAVTPLITSSPQSMLMSTAYLEPTPDVRKIAQDFNASQHRYAMAVRIDGALSSAFTKAPSEQNITKHLSKTKNPVSIIVVADTDFLRDQFWVQQGNVLGQPVSVPYAHNGAFVVNALENLSGNSDLLSLRSRGVSSRPFVVFEEIRRAAETQFRAKEQQIKGELETTERKLKGMITSDQAAAGIVLTPEQQQLIDQFQERIVSLRKDLRTVQRALRENIEALESRLLLMNIVLMPLLVILGAIFVVRRPWRLF